MYNKSKKLYDIIKLPYIEDERGYLSFAESNRQIPFQIKRIYYMGKLIFSGNRGHHAHKKTVQVLFCLKGSALIKFDDGKNKSEIKLDKPNIGVTIPNLVWHSMEDFAKDTLILVLASEPYNEQDYIRNYEDFLRYIQSK